MFSDLCTSVWALSALRVAVESDLLAGLLRGEKDPRSLARASGLDPEAAARILEVLSAHALVSEERGGFTLTEEGRQLASRAEGLRADIAVTFGLTRVMLDEARRGSLGSGWHHADAEVIRGFGALSREVVGRMIGPMVAEWPRLGGLLSRDGARFLEVGIGAAGGAIALARHFPKLRVVGVDPNRTAHREASAAVAAAGLEDRITLVRGRVEELEGEPPFEAAFVPSRFLDAATLAAVFERARTLLVPGGCLLSIGLRAAGDPKRAAVSRLRAHVSGGAAHAPADIARLLDHAGFTSLRELPGGDDAVLHAAFTPDA